jgi:membrane fusion protein, multidrug efflux system
MAHVAGEQGRRSVRAMAITSVALVAVLGGLFGWRVLRGQQDQGWAPQAVQVAAVEVVPHDIPAAIEAVGTLSAMREVVLSPEVAGRIAAIGFSAGQQVGAGRLLVQLYDGPEQADRQSAAARAAFAQAQFARSQGLASSGAESREVLEQRRADRDAAAAALRQVEARLVQKQVRAPFAGQIGIRRVNLGQYLNPGDGVATLTALDQLYVDFNVPQQELSRLKPGTQVAITSDAFPGRSFPARVNAVEPAIGKDTRNVTVQAQLANPGQVLRPGMYVTAALVLPPRRDALLVPATAIQTSAQGDSVIAIRGPHARAEGNAEVVPVQTGARVGDAVVVTSGLRPGDVIVADGQLRVQPGAPVKVVKTVSQEGR